MENNKAEERSKIKMKYDCIYRTYNCGEDCPCSLYTEELVLTEEEERLFKYCEDFCPIYYDIKNFNSCSYEYDNMHTTLYCPSEMCDKITKVCVLRRREKIMKEKTNEEAK